MRSDWQGSCGQGLAGQVCNRFSVLTGFCN
uniref:Uncharacterized protein n=1 Tax=Anguilla anguilla TaxID=7936 RepID=A0A0E9SQP7_ANGAN